MAEDELIKKHTEAAYKAFKDPEKDWKHKFKDILLEILIIVFAVTVSIWLHNWSEDRKDEHAAREFLTGLKGDIEADVKEMKSDRNFQATALKGVSYFEQVGRGLPLNKDSLGAYIMIFFSQTQINPRIGRFDALKSSGKLDIITNKKLQYDIIDLYEKNFPQIFRTNQFNNTLISDKLASFIGDNLELDAKGAPTNAQDVLRKSKMRILLQQAEGFRNSVLAYSQGIDKADDILKQIDTELK